MQLPNRLGKGMKCPIPCSPCPHRQWTGQEIACPWPQGHNSQHARNMQDSHSHSRQPQCYGPGIQNCQCCQQMEPMTSFSPTAATTATKTLNPHKRHACGNCTKSHGTWQSLLPCQGLHMPIMWQNWSLGHQMQKKTPPVDRRIQTRSHPDMGPKGGNKSRPTLLM